MPKSKNAKPKQPRSSELSDEQASQVRSGDGSVRFLKSQELSQTRDPAGLANKLHKPFNPK